MSNKTVMITGATSGIGEALFYRYATLGYQVIACGRNKAKLSELAAFKQGVKILAFDVNNAEQIVAAANKVASIDILILNAGDCQYIDDVMQFNTKVFAQTVATNLVSMGAMLEHFLPKVKRGGQVCFISSSASILPFTRAQAYGASKAGVDYLANSLRLDLVKENIDVALVHPGFIKTPLTDKNTFEMPFILSAEEAASRIYQGISSRKNYIHFPKRLTWTLKVFALLPSFVWRHIAQRSIKT